MRALTDSEARVIAVLLAARPDRERERLRQVENPRSTYHAVRRRAYQEGWLRDRYIPHPVPLGRPYVTVLVARPYADRLAEFTRTVSGDEGNVVLWNGAQLAVAVFFHRKPADGARIGARIEKDRSAAPPLTITVSADGPTIPVYFDFEGLWCHLAGLEGTLAYPHGLGGEMGEPSDEDAAKVTPLSPHQQWAIGELLRRPFTAAEQGRGAHLVGPFGLPFSQRRILARGWITHRTLLEPARLPPYQGRSADQVVLLSGSSKGRGSPGGTLLHPDARLPRFPVSFRGRLRPMAPRSPRWRRAVQRPGSRPPRGPADAARCARRDRDLAGAGFQFHLPGRPPIRPPPSVGFRGTGDEVLISRPDARARGA